MPEVFYDSISKHVKTMSILQKSVRVNDEEIIDISLTYSIVIAMQSTNATKKVENLSNTDLYIH